VRWLLNLYPPRWRRRYGEEFLALIAPQRFSFVTVLDIIGGAIDAWTQPQSHLGARAAAQSDGDTIMLAKMMRLRCAGHGAKTTTADGLKGAGMILGGTCPFSSQPDFHQLEPIDELASRPACIARRRVTQADSCARSNGLSRRCGTTCVGIQH
jgi:hypothetical protein